MKKNIDFDRLQELVKQRHKAKHALALLNEERGSIDITVQRVYTDALINKLDDCEYYEPIELDAESSRPWPNLVSSITRFKEELKNHYQRVVHYAENEIENLLDGQGDENM